MGTAGYQVVAGALGGRTGQNRGFNIQEALLVEVATQYRGHLGAQTQLVGNLRATQVEVSVAQADVFAHFGVIIELERRGFRFVENLDFLTQHLDLAGFHIGVHRRGIPRANPAANLQHILTAHPVSGGKMFLGVGVKNDLHNPVAVAHIQKNNSTVVAAAIYPAANGHVLIDVLATEAPAIMAAHGFFPLLQKSKTGPAMRGPLYSAIGPGGRTTAVSGKIFLLVARFKIGFVPTATLEAKTCRRNFLHQRVRFALRTLRQRGIAHLLQRFQLVLTGLTLIFINGHWNPLPTQIMKT